MSSRRPRPASRPRWRSAGQPLLLLACAIAVLAAVRYWPREPLLAGVPWSTAVYDRDGRLLRLTLASDGRYRLPLPLDAMSPQLVEAVLLHEDRQFHLHPGINPWSLLRGAARTFVVADRRVGGSTVTMQLARRVYRIDSRRIPGKLLQAARALQLEATYSKREILEAYLNLAPYGGNVEGVGAASLVYFQRRAASLPLAAALALAVVPQSPARRQPATDNAALLRARAQLYDEWARRHGRSAPSEAALATPLQVFGVRDLPFAAPHQVQAVLAASAHAAAQPGPATEITTTLELRTQRLLERQLQGFVSRQRRFGVSNAAALLVDIDDLSVVASVGSASFFDATIAGQNDGTRARRSPGSALKPFIYALAMDQGLVHPMTVLKDTPQSFGAFAPENFDGDFAGPVTVQDALIRSRNVPAVAVGARLTQPGFHSFLRSAGVGELQGERHYGLAIFLGGAEVTMREMAALYAMLANGGVLQPLQDVASSRASSAAGVRLLSEGASYITLDMLAHNPRPAQAFLNGAVRRRGPAYWKTGTSTGFRDAWSVAVFDHYVLVVWVGNFDGRPNPAFVGVQVAAPLMFQVIDALRAAAPAPRVSAARPAVSLDRPASMLRPPASLSTVEVCADSGDLPNAACPRVVRTAFIPGVSPIRASNLHRLVRVDQRTGLQACAGAPAGFVRSEVHEFWESDMLEQFRRAGLPRRPPPPADPRCNPGDAGNGPQITSPLQGVSYLLRDGEPGAPLALTATSDASSQEVYWFANEVFVGRAPRGAPLEWRPPRAGRYTLRVVDDAGRAARRELQVALAPAGAGR